MKLFYKLGVSSVRETLCFVEDRNPNLGDEYVLLFLDHHSDECYVLQKDIDRFFQEAYGPNTTKCTYLKRLSRM